MSAKTSQARATPATTSALLRHLPAVGRATHHPRLLETAAPEWVRAAVARDAVAQVRAAIEVGAVETAEQVAAAAERTLCELAQHLQGPSLRPALNATGVLLHTNLGRSPLPRVALQAAWEVAGGYNTLELDVSTGERGSRQSHCTPLLRWLTGAEDALVVNNGAAAILLALSAVARDRPVIVSRGELVEIGGGFRVPEIMQASGAQLVEVGTTNRTHKRDYARALQALVDQGRPAAALLRVHRSNFAVVGFEAHLPTGELAALGAEFGVPLIVDLGSGALDGLPVAPAGLPDGSVSAPEPTVGEILAAGAAIVTFSGDKLVGGPQAGIAVGNTRLVQAMAQNPLARALRVGSLTVAALEAVLREHLLRGPGQLPAIAQLAEPEQASAERAERWCALLNRQLAPAVSVDVVPSVAQVGGGTHPLLVLPSRALSIAVAGMSADAAAAALRAGPLPILGRVRHDRLLWDVTTLWAGRAALDEPGLVAALVAALGSIC